VIVYAKRKITVGIDWTPISPNITTSNLVVANLGAVSAITRTDPLDEGSEEYLHPGAQEPVQFTHRNCCGADVPFLYAKVDSGTTVLIVRSTY
jgi:hypothetical protein